MHTRIALVIVLMLLAVHGAGCDVEFDPPSEIQSLRFLGMIAEPLEGTPGGTITFSAVVAEADGNVYDGPVAWAIVGGEQLRATGETGDSPTAIYLQPSPDEPFVWAIPSAGELAAAFGAPEENGWLLTVAASVFENGDPTAEAKAAYKLFVVSDREPEQRLRNPVLVDVQVAAGGNRLQPDADGQFLTRRSRVDLRAIVAEPNGDQTFHWFATSDTFEPDFAARQSFNPESPGSYRVFCVVRESFFFEHDDNSSTRVTGQDAWNATIRFE